MESKKEFKPNFVVTDKAAHIRDIFTMNVFMFH